MVELVSTAIYVINRSPSSVIDFEIPEKKSMNVYMQYYFTDMFVSGDLSGEHVQSGMVFQVTMNSLHVKKSKLRKQNQRQKIWVIISLLKIVQKGKAYSF